MLQRTGRTAGKEYEGVPVILTMYSRCFNEPECQDVCGLVDTQECTTITKEECRPVRKRYCSVVEEPVCSTVYEKQCSTVRERQCSTGMASSVDTPHICPCSV